MFSRFFKKHERVDPEELNRQTEAVNDALERTAGKRDLIATYLKERKDQNGFGRDFEYTLRPKGSY